MPESRITLSMRGNSPSSSSSMNSPKAVYAALVMTWPMAHTGIETLSAKESGFHN